MKDKSASLFYFILVLNIVTMLYLYIYIYIYIYYQLGATVKSMSKQLAELKGEIGSRGAFDSKLTAEKLSLSKYYLIVFVCIF